MTGAALQLSATPHVATLGGNHCADGKIVWWTADIARRRARVASVGTGSRPPRHGDGQIILWPVRYWPQRPGDVDAAIIQIWRLHSYGVIDSVEVAVREIELRAMRSWMP
jgi:hypothetical protein